MTDCIEDLILQHDRRGISALRGWLPADFCQRAARLLQRYRQRVIIVTGFYLANYQSPETDGPPGALAIGRAAQALGGSVRYVIEPCLLDGMRAAGGDHQDLWVFPVLPAADSLAVARRLVAEFRPSLVISVEHCGQSVDGVYRNSRGVDISACTAKPDGLFTAGIPSIGIGDGGNEIGMGNLADVIPTIANLPQLPAVTRVDELVIASISNWGAYGLVAALSELVGVNLLPDLAGERALITRLYETGCFDGLQATRMLGVDGFDLEAYSVPLRQLHARLEHLRQRHDLHPG